MLSNGEVSYVTGVESRDKYHFFISFHRVTVFGSLLQFTLNVFFWITLRDLVSLTSKLIVAYIIIDAPNKIYA